VARITERSGGCAVSRGGCNAFPQIGSIRGRRGELTVPGIPDQAEYPVTATCIHCGRPIRKVWHGQWVHKAEEEEEEGTKKKVTVTRTYRPEVLDALVKRYPGQVVTEQQMREVEEEFTRREPPTGPVPGELSPGQEPTEPAQQLGQDIEVVLGSLTRHVAKLESDNDRLRRDNDRLRGQVKRLRSHVQAIGAHVADQVGEVLAISWD
jgi:hypothetical protein